MWDACIAGLPFLHRLTAAELARLKTLTETILATKPITGAAELEMTDEIAVAIAAQASLPVLNLTLELYDDMAAIIVYPSAFLVPMTEIDEAGVVHEWREPLSGEAVTAGGAVVLSWEDSQGGPDRDSMTNVVIHEFAHKIDMAHGTANGFPPLLARFHENLDAREWQTEFSRAYRHFSARVDQIARQWPEDTYFNNFAAGPDDPFLQSLPLDPYAASHPAEFFAVASEVFFISPQPLIAEYPAVYRLLSQYYRQDPLDKF